MRRSIEKPGSAGSTTNALMPEAAIVPSARRSPGAVEHVMMPVASRRARHRRDVRSGLGLGERERGDRSARGNPRQIACAQLDRARERKGAAAQSLHREREVRESVPPGERLAQQAYGARVEVGERAAVRRANAVTRQTGRAEIGDESVACCVHLCASAGMRVARQVRGSPLTGTRRERAMHVVEERPIEMIRSHQSPSKTGLRRATNASYARRKSPVCMHIACACASASIA
jgi:hypothetical protein